MLPNRLGGGLPLVFVPIFLTAPLLPLGRIHGIRPPRRDPYARARGLSAEEVARLLAAIPVESAAGLRLRALVLAYLLTGRRRSEGLHPRRRGLALGGGFYRYTGQ